MTNRPRLALEGTFAPGLLAVALFALMATIVWNTPFESMAEAGFPEGVSVTAELGYAMFDLEALQSGEGAMADTEPFLAAFLLIAVLLDAALDAALVLAKREEGGEPVSPLASGSDRPAAEPAPAAVADGGREARSAGDATDPGDGSDGDRARSGQSDGGEA